MATSLVVAESAPVQQVISPAVVSERLLDSWKEIASFFGRTTRTVQRWEMAENLPVHRHVHEKSGSVYALESELIAWRDARCRHSGEGHIQERAPNRQRLAVLPFANLSLGPTLRHFEDGVTSEIIAQLAGLDPARLGVVARTSVMRYKKSRHTIAQIGRHLKVGYVLEGSVGLAGRQVRIAAQLISVRDQTHLFGENCATPWTGRASIQVAFAERIARMVCKYLLMSRPNLE